MDDFDFDQLNMDEIKYGLIGTTDEENKWFEYKLNKIKLKISVDTDDNDIINLQLIGDLSAEVIKLLSIIGAGFELKTKDKQIE